ncbi:MAG: protein translocase subunit SecF [Bdellovibrionota bacterium]
MGNRKTNYFDTTGSGRFDFIKNTKILVAISGLAVLASLIYIAAGGLNYGIDFKGGTEVQVQFDKPVETSQVRAFMDQVEIKDPQILKFGTDSEFLIRFQNEERASIQESNEFLAATVKKITEGLKSTFANEGPVVERVDSVGPQVGSQLKKNSLLAVFYSLLLILIYIGLRFDYVYAPGAVVCLFHDAIVTLGVLALVGKEINVTIMAAILTIIGYSLNDTIVIFDRIRENKGLYPDKQFPWIINKAMNEMLARTITTSATTLACVLCLYFFADGVIKDFALAMSIGIVAGSYSTIYVASPAVILCDRLQNRKKMA